MKKSAAFTAFARRGRIILRLRVAKRPDPSPEFAVNFHEFLQRAELDPRWPKSRFYGVLMSQLKEDTQ